MEANLTITGHVGSAVEFRPTQPNNISRATFRLGCTPRVLRQGSWTDDHTTWLTVVCWRSLADHVSSSLRRGDPIVALGRLRTQAWSDDDGHHERTVLEAVTVGHDLSRGTSSFQRMQRADPPYDADTKETAETITTAADGPAECPVPEEERAPVGLTG